MLHMIYILFYGTALKGFSNGRYRVRWWPHWITEEPWIWQPNHFLSPYQTTTAKFNSKVCLGNIFEISLSTPIRNCYFTVLSVIDQMQNLYCVECLVSRNLVTSTTYHKWLCSLCAKSTKPNVMVGEVMLSNSCLLQSLWYVDIKHLHFKTNLFQEFALLFRLSNLTGFSIFSAMKRAMEAQFQLRLQFVNKHIVKHLRNGCSHGFLIFRLCLLTFTDSA